MTGQTDFNNVAIVYVLAFVYFKRQTNRYRRERFRVCRKSSVTFSKQPQIVLKSPGNNFFDPYLVRNSQINMLHGPKLYRLALLKITCHSTNSSKVWVWPLKYGCQSAVKKAWIENIFYQESPEGLSSWGRKFRGPFSWGRNVGRITIFF